MNNNRSLFQHQAYVTTKTYFIMGLFAVVVIALGYWLSVHYQNSTILYVMVGFSVVMNIVSYWFSDSIALRMSHARELEQGEYPDYRALTDNLCRKANLPMPRLYIIDDEAPNAFATGRDKNHSAVAVTTGLLRRLERAELEGVIAHELAHIGNRDILLMSVATIVAGFVAIVADIVGRGALIGDGENRGLVGFLLVILSGILAQIGAAMIVAAVSRRREYDADETGALISGNPRGLAGALRKISSYEGPMEHAHNATAHLFISNPFGAFAPLRLLASHPPVEKRIARLESM